MNKEHIQIFAKYATKINVVVPGNSSNGMEVELLNLHGLNQAIQNGDLYTKEDVEQAN